MRERIRTTPSLVETSPEHQKAIADGSDHYRMWERNVIDEFKSLSEEDIKIKLKANAFPYAVCFENLINDFNISSAIRNANAFNAKEVFYIGDKRFDRRGMQGVHNYMDITWLPTIDSFLQLKKSYKIIGFDNISGAKPMSSYVWEPNSMIVFGSEGVGLSSGMKDMCQEFVYIEQFGSVRSLNVATASGIAMNDIITKFRNIK